MTRLDDLLSTAERAVERALGRPKVQAAEAYVTWERDTAATVERSSVSSVQAGESYGIALRVLYDGRIGFAYVTQDDELGRGIEEANQASRLSKKFRFEFARPRVARPVAGVWDPRIERAQPESVVQAAADLVQSVRDVRRDLNAAGGGVSLGTIHSAIANSEGVSVAERRSGFSAYAYVVQDLHGVSTGSAGRASCRHDVSITDVAHEAARLAVATEKTVRLEGSAVRDVVLYPEPAADLVGTITIPNLSGRAVHRNESYYGDRLGQQVASGGFGIREDPGLPEGLGSSMYDDEGVPSRRVPLISRGVLKGFLYDVATAAEFDGRTTASAVRSGGVDGRSYKAPPAVGSRQIHLVSPRTTTEKLISGIDDGVLVHDLMGVHTANVVSGDFGATASILFRIKDGEVAEALEPASVSGNMHEALSRGLRLGDDVRPVDHGTAFVLPSTLVRGLSVTP